jgi:acyl-CoA thioester hydrolase
VQVFLQRDNFMLQLTNPAFFEEWKKKYGFWDLGPVVGGRKQ